ncbi:MAG: Tol-Pal system beta propeller repeat protein TolB [Endomicrobium sp.]|jgi:TolB protein|nr:Tol-Pal system beta propeller repeat protein TolB [Endomicrobium sp.]
MKKFFIFFYIILHLSTYVYAQSDIYLSLVATNACKKLSIIIGDFTAIDKNENTIKTINILRDIIKSDLIHSRYFNVTEKKDISVNSFKEKLLSYEYEKTSVFIIADIAHDINNNLIINIKILDITGKVIWECKYIRELTDYRYMCHEASDEIIKILTGEIGIARSKIAFVSNSTGFKEIYVVDYDGYNLRRLTKDNKINILPRWSPDGRCIIYTSYLHNNPDLFVLDIVKNRRLIVSKYQGLNVAGSFSPDGKKILLTLSKGNYPNLYLINTSGEIIRRITNNFCIDTSPSFSPNGQEIVFISDRTGYPQLYIMNLEGGNIRRLTTSGFCDSPSWSPCGDKIAFTMKQQKCNNYDLYIYDLPTAKILKLTNNQKNNENPSFSPDGRFITFYSNRSGKGEIYVISVDGLNTRKLTELSGASYTPSWSPVLMK